MAISGVFRQAEVMPIGLVSGADQQFDLPSACRIIEPATALDRRCPRLCRPQEIIRRGQRLNAGSDGQRLYRLAAGLAERMPERAVVEHTGPAFKAACHQRAAIGLQGLPGKGRAVQQVDLHHLEAVEHRLVAGLAREDMAAEVADARRQGQFGLAAGAEFPRRLTRFGVVRVEVDLLLKRAMAQSGACKIQDDAVGLDDAGIARRVDAAQAAPDRLNEGPLVQHRAQDADAAHRLAVEAFRQHHAVGEDEAALWAVDTTSSFSSAVLKAVNLGDDADSVGSVAGQLAGARYGLSAIPQDWLDVLIHKAQIERIGRTLFQAGEASGVRDVF